MIADMLASLERMNTDVAAALDAVTPKPSDETSPRGVLEAHAQLAGQVSTIDAAIASAKGLAEALVDLRGAARTKPVVKKPRPVKKAAVGRKR